MRRLAVPDLAEVVAIQEAVTAALPQGYVRKKSEADLREYLDGSVGLAYGIGAPAALQAMSLLRVPSRRHPNLVGGPPFPIVPPADWPLQAGFVENTLVLPEARGRGHQRALLDRRLADAEAAGMRWLCGGGHLENVASWRNLLARGFVVAGIRLDYGFPVIGLLYAFDPRALASNAGDALRAPLRDVAMHEAALAGGYVGVSVDPDDTIVYQRRRGR
jgi:GNAT superfamily N-acetyltransferase